MSYWRFFAMIITSTVVMYGLMYANSYSIEQVFYSESRVYMALYMGGMMAVVMLAFMLGMYSNKTANIAIFVGAGIVFGLALYLMRSQVTVQDRSWMSAMIPHHSIAILTSSRAEISDPRVKKLAEEIVVAQNREIAEMRYLIDDIERNGEAGDDFPLGKTDEPAAVESIGAALSSVEIAGVRPSPLTEEEIGRVVPDATCRFRRAVDADPILAVSGDKGVIKVSGSLIELAPEGTDRFSADKVNVSIAPAEDGTDMIFDLTTDPALRVGFNGYWNC